MPFKIPDFLVLKRKKPMQIRQENKNDLEPV